jgi:hypothetical protein
MKRLVGLLVLAALVPGCNPIVIGAVLAAAKEPETEHLKVINETNYFHRSADHHDFKSTETYTWHNCGEQAVVDGEVTPSCPNDITIRILDADKVEVFLQTYHAPHCFKGKKDWDPLASAKGRPGDWTIEFTFDITGVRDLIFDITSAGEIVEVVTSEGSAGEEEHGEEEGGHVWWKAPCVEGRTQAESYTFPMSGCGTATVTAEWVELTSGSMRVTVKDADGAVVFDHFFDPGHETPYTGQTSEGASGNWTVTFEAVDLSAEEMSIKVQG